MRDVIDDLKKSYTIISMMFRKIGGGIASAALTLPTETTVIFYPVSDRIYISARWPDYQVGIG
jgi:hypothetical protein